MPKFSIVIPTYNGAKTIARTLESVLNQSISDWEAVVVDDGSADNTADVVRPFLQHKNIRYHKRENAGVSAARNYGVHFCTGPFLVFLDSDDEVKPEWLEDFDNLTLTSGAESGYLSCGYVYAGTKYPPRSGRGFSPQPYLSAPAGTFVISREVFASIGGYDSKLRQSENWEMAARALDFCTRNKLSVLHTTNCNIFWHNTKTRSQLRARDLATAEAHLHLYRKYRREGILQYRCDRFVLAVAVNYARAGRLKKARKWFYSAFLRYPSLKALARIFCFEIPFLRKKLWMSRKFKIDIPDDER